MEFLSPVKCLTKHQWAAGFEPRRHHCVVSLLVLNQPRKTCPDIIEKLLTGT